MNKLREKAISKLSENALDKPWADDDPQWQEMINIYTDHLTYQALTLRDIQQLVRLAELFNVLSNQDLLDVIKKYPDYPQTLKYYW